MSVDFKDGIQREQIRLVMEQVPTMQAVSFIVALVLVYVVRDIVPPANIFVWVLMVFLIVCSRVRPLLPILQGAGRTVWRGILEESLSDFGPDFRDYLGGLRLYCFPGW